MGRSNSEARRQSHLSACRIRGAGMSGAGTA